MENPVGPRQRDLDRVRGARRSKPSSVPSAVNSRLGAVVRVEYNYFKNVSDTVVSQDSPTNGTWQVNDNVFDGCSGPTTSTGSLTPPYTYTPDPVANLPTAIPAGAGVGKL